jgi:hypothetical protein
MEALLEENCVLNAQNNQSEKDRNGVTTCDGRLGLHSAGDELTQACECAGEFIVTPAQPGLSQPLGQMLLPIANTKKCRTSASTK